MEKKIKESDEDNKPENTTKGKDPVKVVTWLVLLLAALIFVWYVFSDRFTPYAQQARVTEIYIPVSPRVSGTIISVNTGLNSEVKAGDLLFRIDTVPYYLAVKRAKANIDNVMQQVGAQSAGVKAAASAVGVARAQLDRAQRNYDRTMRIIKKNPGALSQAEIDHTETSLNTAIENLANAEANLSKAKKQLGPQGEDNPQLRMAINDLNNAVLQLEWTKVYAPVDGFIESINLEVGYFAQAGSPLCTLLSKDEVWIQADFKENNLSNMKAGNKVEFILDVAPGKIFEGTVKSISRGVDAGNGVVPGQLPVVKSQTSWLQDPQRFPVIISFSDTSVNRYCRAGGQADVVVYTGKHPFLNTTAHIRILLNTWLSYVR